MILPATSGTILKPLSIYKNYAKFLHFMRTVSTHIAQNIAETCQKYLESLIANEILSQHFCQILRNISSQHYNFNILKYF